MPRCFACGKSEREFKTGGCKPKGEICLLSEWQASKKKKEDWLNLLVAGIFNSGKTYFLMSLIRSLLSDSPEIKRLYKPLRLH